VPLELRDPRLQHLSFHFFSEIQEFLSQFRMRTLFSQPDGKKGIHQLQIILHLSNEIVSSVHSQRLVVFDAFQRTPGRYIGDQRLQQRLEFVFPSALLFKLIDGVVKNVAA
jgi:hypothetical protein